MWNNIKSLLKAFIYAFNGILTAIKTQRNFRIHIVITIYVFAASLFYNFSKLDYAVLTLICVIIMSLELINTALESVVDICSPEYSKLAKTAKDCAAGAVLISAIGAIFIGVCLFGDMNVIKSIFSYYRNHSPALIFLFISIVIAVFFIVYPFNKMKGKNNEYKN